MSLKCKSERLYETKYWNFHLSAFWRPMGKVTQDFCAPPHHQDFLPNKHLPLPQMECLGYSDDPRGSYYLPTPGDRHPGQKGKNPIHGTGLVPCNELANESGQACYLLHTVLCGSEQNTSCTRFLCHSQFRSAHLFVLGF